MLLFFLRTLPRLLGASFGQCVESRRESLWKLWHTVVTGGLTLSSERLAAKVDGEQETGYVERRAHLIEIPQRIVDEKTEKSLLW